MKNLKINRKLISLITAGAISLSLAGCSPRDNDNKDNKDNTNSTIYQLYEGKLENNIADNVVTDNGLCNVNDLSVVSRSTKEALDIKKIQVLVKENNVNTLKSIDRDLTLFFSNDISAIYYEGKEISLDDYMIVDKSGMEVGTIRQLFVDNKEVEISQNNNGKATVITLSAVDSAIQTLSNKLNKQNVKYDSNDILKTLILINLPTLSDEVNSNIYNELMIRAGNPDINSLFIGRSNLINAFNDPDFGRNNGSNYSAFYDGNVAYEDLIHLGDLVLDKTQKAIYDDVNNRLVEMSKNLATFNPCDKNDKTTLNGQIVDLWEDIEKGTFENDGIYANINAGTVFALSPRFADARGMIFMVCEEDDKCITIESQVAVKMLAPYATDTEREQEESLYRSTLYTDMASIFNAKGKTLTLTK